ncbi:phosphotransferase family protein [Mycobacterium sp. EPa45]|uniref:phosphotransferase family protein n=1 Tax=Mycobacterium sp. EPa45 TaxID=1545728 RepID=UPI000641EE17|nr:phosphotransferase family protein [Mycobacterium sp. EPa45]AKK25477.1 acyl-CoA dehydrogenase [Mycobacterium sp. EPa45]
MIDLARLSAWLDGEDLPGRGQAVEAVAISSGTQNEIYEIHRSDLHAVLRIPPLGAPLDRDDGILREWRILSALKGSGVPHADALALCADREVLGRNFYLSAYLDGWSSANSTVWPPPYAHDVSLRAELAHALLDAAVSLGAFDWRGRGLADFGQPEGFHERQVSRWSAMLASSTTRVLPGADVATAWLKRSRPIDYIPGRMHGDYQFANVLFEHSTPARVAGIIDWEMSTIGDPKLDVAWALQFWPDDTEDPAVIGTHHAGDLFGMPSRTALAEYYGTASGRQMDDFDYYLVLARWKLAVVLERGFQRAPEDEKLAAFGDSALASMAAAAELAESSTYRPPQ